ncbi:transcriptional repressor CTCFL-like isoform X2 [Watersipora subatra]|uniref:transcriptional repressor CTCFL-like isoform X2 n=1 Tax=Watersipora subatra TaxID=2589382 RepID=UPI00355B2F51
METEHTISEEGVPSISGLPLSANGQPPLIVTLAPKSATPEKLLTDENIETLQAAMQSRSISELAQAIRSIKPLSFEIRKQNSQVLNVHKNKAIKRPHPVRDAQRESLDEPTPPPIIKKRAPRSKTAERRRPWKPERLDPSKPILQCDACGYQANRRDYMRRHQIRVHSDYRPYQCTLCDFKTTEKHDLDRHMNSKYHGGKGMSQKRQRLAAIVKIKCDQCTYSTKSVSSILKHKQSHRLEQRQAEYEQQLEEDDGGEPLDDETDALERAEEDMERSEGVMKGAHEVMDASEDMPSGEIQSLSHAVDSTDELGESDAVAVLMMNDLMAQGSGE